MYKFLTDYPADLTNKSWQKAKSFLDKNKAKTKTGLGDALEKAEAEWKRINWPALDASQAMGKVDQSAKYRSAKEFDFAKAVGIAEMKGKVAAASRALLEAGKVALETSKNKDLSKDAVKKATALSKGLIDQSRLLRDGIDLSDFDEKRDRWLELQKMQMAGFKKAVSELEAALKQVAQDPTKKTFNEKAKQKFRSVGNTLGNNEQFKEQWKVWVKFDGGQADNHPELKKGVDPETEKKIILQIVKDALPHLQKLKQQVGT